MKLILEEFRDDACKAELKALIESCSLGEIIKTWVNDKRKLRICGGFDEKDRSKRIYLVFEDEVPTDTDAGAGAAYCSMDEVLRSRPQVKDLIPPPLLITNLHRSCNCEDDDYYEKRAKLMGEDYDDEINGSIYSLEAALDGALGLALSDHSETNFYKIPEGLLEDMEEELREKYDKNFLAINSYRSEKDRFFSEVYCDYIDLRKEWQDAPSPSFASV